MDRLISMSVFVKAADMGSFAAAADATGLSATMVGKHVQFLETRLGVRLLSRTTRRQSLTEFGRAYYDRCRLILAEANAADAMASDHLNTPHGTLRMTMPALLGRICVAPILFDLASRYPSLRLDLSFDDHIVDIIGESYDLSVRTGGVADRAGLMSRRIASHSMLVCASPGYLAEYGAPHHLDDLSKHKALAYERPGWSHAWLFRDTSGGKIEVLPPSGIRLDDLAVVADAAVLGSGLAWLPSFLAQPHIESGALIRLLEHQPCHVFENYAVWPQAAHLPLKVRMAIDVLISKLPHSMA